MGLLYLGGLLQRKREIYIFLTTADRSETYVYSGPLAARWLGREPQFLLCFNRRQNRVLDARQGQTAKSLPSVFRICWQSYPFHITVFSLVSSLLWRFRVCCLINPILSYSTITFLFLFSPERAHIYGYSQTVRQCFCVWRSRWWTASQPGWYGYGSLTCQIWKSVLFVMCVMLLCIVSGTSFDFHKQTEHLFLVGTEDGKIHKVCKICVTGNSVAINEKDKSEWELL